MKVKVNHVFYCYHPDFEQDGDTYNIKDTGKWVVEWSVRDGSAKGLSSSDYSFYKAGFDTEEEAKKFQMKLIAHQDDNGFVTDKNDICIDKKYLVKQQKSSGLSQAFTINAQFQPERSEI